jgi:dephospho-CoA kinase
MLIGIVGQIGSGKSQVAGIFKKYGGFVISADKIGKQIVDNNPAILKKLITVFGNQIVTKGGRLRRRKLGQIAFSSKSNLARLNRIIHPYLIKELVCQTTVASIRNKLIIIDAALLINWGWHEKVDYTLLVQASSKITEQRLLKKGLLRDEIRTRRHSQLSNAKIKKFADFIVSNNDSPDFLEAKVRKIIKKLCRKGLTLTIPK